MLKLKTHLESLQKSRFWWVFEKEKIVSFTCENKYSSNMEIEQGKELLLEPNLAWFAVLL